MNLTTADIISDLGLVAIGSATGTGGLRARFSQHIDNPGRLEQAALECRCGFNHLAICWTETPDLQTAVAYEAALLRDHFARWRRLPSLTSLDVLTTVGPLPTQEETAALAWSGLYALTESNTPSVPTQFGVYAISAAPPEDPEIWDPPKGEMTLYACPFAEFEPSCRRRSGASCGATGAPKTSRTRPRRRLEDFLE